MRTQKVYNTDKITNNNIIIAVVVVNWNGKKYLKDCFDSLENQTYRHFKVIFVDNGSEDESAYFVAKNYPNAEIIKLQENTGFCFGYNTGIKRVLDCDTVKYILILNNDTKLDHKFLEEIVNCAKKYPSAGSIQPKVTNFYDPDKIDCAGIYISRDGTAHNRGYGKKAENFNQEKEIFGANGTASLFARSALEKTAFPNHNYFDNAHFAFYEDVDLAWRLKKAGFQTIFCPKALVLHIHSGTAGKRSLLKAYYLHRNYFFTAIKNYPLGKLIKTLFWRMLSYFNLIIGVFRKKKREAEYVAGYGKRKAAIAILKAWGSVIYNLPDILKKRKIIQRIENINQ